jgi:hypothetical protein
VCLDEDCNTIKIDPEFNLVIADISGQRVDISGQRVDISGQRVTADISGQRVDISGQRVTADISGQMVSAKLDLSNASGDAFGRLRISNPYTLFEFHSIIGKQPTIIDEQTTGTATDASANWVSGDSYVNMVVTTTGNTVIRQSHDYIPYQPGKSRLVMMTGVLFFNPTNTNITARIGSYDTTIGGVYIQFSNGRYSINLAKIAGSDGTGTTTAYRDGSDSELKWTDKLDGTGPSGATVNFNKAQIFVFDYEWLGVGQVRCGIVQGGKTYYYYTFTHADALTSPYVQMVKLPLRYEIISNGSANSMRMICGTVISEGGFSPPGRQYLLSTDTSTTAFELPNTNNLFRPVLSLSLRKDTDLIYRRGTIKIEAIDIFNSESNIAGSWKILLNPDISGAAVPDASWTIFDASKNSIARYYREPSNTRTITNDNFVLYQGYFTQRTSYVFTTSIEELVASKGIASDIAGNPDVFVLAVNWLVGSNNTKVYSAIRWAEIV